MNGFVTQMCKSTSIDEIFKKHLFAEDVVPEFDGLVSKAVTGTRDKNGQFLKKTKPIDIEVRKMERAQNKLIYKVKL